MCWGALPSPPPSAEFTLYCLRCLKQMAEEGFQPQLLFTSLVLEEEDRAALLRAVVKGEPAFCPPPQASNLVSTPVLLKDFYSKVSPRQEAMTARLIPFLHQEGRTAGTR